jgi:twitching motility two-component system response regulator PilH
MARSVLYASLVNLSKPILDSFIDLEAFSLISEKVNKKVLIVDDEPDMRIFVSNLLNSNGFSPITAKSKTEGLRKAIEENPAVIILDMMMPGESGIQMYRDLKQWEKLKHVPVIMLSTIDRETFFKFHIVRGSPLNKVVLEPDTFLEKPLEAKDLINLVRALTTKEGN